MTQCLELHQDTFLIEHLFIYVSNISNDILGKHTGHH